VKMPERENEEGEWCQCARGRGGLFVVGFFVTLIGNWRLEGSFSKPSLATNLEKRVGSHESFEGRGLTSFLSLF